MYTCVYTYVLSLHMRIDPDPSMVIFFEMRTALRFSFFFQIYKKASVESARFKCLHVTILYIACDGMYNRTNRYWSMMSCRRRMLLDALGLDYFVPRDACAFSVSIQLLIKLVTLVQIDLGALPESKREKNRE